MQLTAIFLLGMSLQVTAAGFGQSLTFSGKDVSLEKAFVAIEQQTGYFVSFKDNQLRNASPVTVQANDMELREFLALVLKNQPFDFLIREKTIFIRKKNVVERVTPRIMLETAAPPVTGIVRAPDGQPLAGVNIMVKGTKRGTVTGKDGSFSIEAKEGEALIISSIGFAEKQISLGTNSTVGIVELRKSESKLDEVQIIAYGQKSRRLNTGSVVSIKSTDIEKQPVNNPLLALQGRVPGLQITPSTGLNGGPVTLQIRGKNSLNFTSEPLVVIDGVPVYTNINGLGHEFSALNQLSTLNFINTRDIESIEVLKDADATSIYGSRGANGIVLITTKKGRVQKTTIDINVQSGWAEVARKLKLLNTQQYLELRKESVSNSGIDLDAPPYNSEIFRRISFPDLKLWDSTRYTDWQEEIIGGNAKYSDVQGFVAGGTSSIQYLIGGNYHKETTVFARTGAVQRGGARISLTGITPNQKFKATVGASYLIDNTTLPGIDLTEQAITLAPNAPALYNEDGSLNWDVQSSGSSGWENPYRQLYRTYDATVNNLMANADISYNVLPSLTLKAQLGYTDLRGESFRNIFPFEERAPEEASANFGSAGFNTNGTKSLNIEPQINYKTKISQGNLSVLVGGSYQRRNAESQQIVAEGATSNALLRNLASATAFYLSNSSSQYKYSAVFARLDYNWKNKYLINLNARRDGSSRFGPGKQFGNFGSIGTAWIFSEENIIKDNFSILSFGKLRFSYGSSGNDGIGDYKYLERFRSIDVSDPYQGVRGYTTTGLFNKYFAWEVTRKMEFGLELGFLQDRFLLIANYFRNRSDNQLESYPYPSIAGPGGALVNIPALVQNSGLEFTLNTENVKTRNFQWSSSFNISTGNRNKLIKYPFIENSPYYESIIGEPFYGIDRRIKYGGVDPATGRYQFINVNNEVVFDPEDPSREDFGYYLRINTLPKYYGGIGNTFNYKNWNLNVFFQFTKQLGINPLFQFLDYSAGRPRNMFTDLLSRWRKPGDESDVQKIHLSIKNPSDYRKAQTWLGSSDFYYADASFLRLKNLSLSYSIPEVWKSKTGISDLKVFLLAQNLLTITNYKGLDPETRSITTLPPLRTVTFGIQVVL